MFYDPEHPHIESTVHRVYPSLEVLRLIYGRGDFKLRSGNEVVGKIILVCGHNAAWIKNEYHRSIVTLNCNSKQHSLYVYNRQCFLPNELKGSEAI